MDEEREEQCITINRIFRLGDYKSLQVQVRNVELPDAVRELIMYENAIDAYMQLCVHQKVHNLMEANGDADGWDERINRLKEIRAEIRAEFKAEEN